MNRLRQFVREHMVDNEEVDKQVQRSRKEWEDLNIAHSIKGFEIIVNIGSALLRSPLFKKLVNSRDAQEWLRTFVLSTKVRRERYCSGNA